MEYFGQTWDAPVCETTRKVPVPVGRVCLRCGVPIEAGDQGVLIPYAPAKGSPHMAPWHWRCFMREVVGPDLRTGALGIDAPPAASLSRRFVIGFLRVTRRWRRN